MKLSLYCLLVASLLFAPLFAQENDEPKKPTDTEEGAEAEEAEDESPPAGEDRTVATRHRGVFGGEEMAYTAVAGTMVITKKEKEPSASVFYVAYTRDSDEEEFDPAGRPLVFCFNGGPGSSAVWLHLGGFGPKRVQMTPEGMMPAPPFRLGDNPASILRVADLVFVDPVSTGFSRSGDEEKVGEFHSFKGDLDSMAEFVRLYTTRNERWLSPKFLAGESYGALRAAGLAQVLHQDFGLYLNGLVLVSGVLSFDTLWGGDLAYVTFLPALSEVAAFHGKLEQALLGDPDARRAAVEEFANGEYAAALRKGRRIEEEEKRAMAERIERFTGIDAETVLRHDLRLSSSFFRQELLRDEGLMIGRFDARVTGRDGNPAGTHPKFDASYAAVFGPFSATLNDYVRRELKFESDLVYEILSSRVRPWDYGDNFVGQPVNILPQLASVLSENPSLKIQVNCGYQDLATPWTAIRHSLNHLEIDPARLDNVEYTFYEGGHMMYTVEESNAAWNADVADFIIRSSGGE